MSLNKDTVLATGLTNSPSLVGGTRSMQDIISYMINTGRSAVMAFGDSTVRHGSIGMHGAITETFNDWVAECGKMLPINCNFGYNQNGDGLIHTRRRENSNSKLGISQSLPGAWDGQYIAYGATGWVGPEPALLGRTTLNGAIDSSVTTLTVTSTSEFPSSGRLQIDNEVIQYSGKTATTFTGCTRGNISTTAASHVDASVVSFVSLGYTNAAWNIAQSSGINPKGNIIQTLFYSPHGAAVATSSFDFTYGTCQNFEQAAAVTNRNTGSSIQLTAGSATLGGDVSTTEHGYSGATLESLTMVTGQTQWASAAFIGVRGPGFIRSMYFGDKDRATGFVTTTPISQGGKTLNNLITGLLTTNNKNGLAKYLWDYAKIRTAAMGGNGNSRLTVFNVWGHNESATSGIMSSFVDPAYPWSIKATTTVVADNTTNIVVADASGLNTTGMLGGHILINNERIQYTTVTGNTLSGLTRGFAATTTAVQPASSVVYQGWLPSHPDGIAADLLFFWNIIKTAWTSNPTVGSTFTEDQIDFVYVRPTCMSDAPVAIADTSAITDRHTREFKLRRFAQVISSRLTPIIPGFVLLDLGAEMTYAERTANNWTVSESDDVHDSYLGYKIPMARAFSRHMRGGGRRSPNL